MTDDHGYNGYTNYKTWAMSLWINKDQGMHNCLVDMAVEADDVSDLTTDIEAWIRDEMPDLGVSVWTDLLTAAVGKVDWAEIADLAWAEYHEDDEDDEHEMDDDDWGDMVYHQRVDDDLTEEINTRTEQEANNDI